MKRLRVGIIGCGYISGIYITNMTGMFCSVLELAACADIDVSRAAAAAAKGGCRACTVEELLADPSIELVVNLTNPKAHQEIGEAVLEAGKHLYTEKPLSVSLDGAARLLDLARTKGLRVGCAPDTFLGAGLQTSRAALDDGRIGKPAGVSGFVLTPGQELWHPEPDFYYQAGGGPLLDMGPYYLTAMVFLLGSIRRVAGFSRITHAERVIPRGPRTGQRIRVEVPTYVTAVLEFENPLVGNLATSFDVWATALPHIEIHGTEATLSVPDPDRFAGPVRVGRRRTWEDVALVNEYAENARGIGVADMALAISKGAPHRATGDLAYHVREVIQAIERSAAGEGQVSVASRVERPEPLPRGLRIGELG